MDFEKLIAIIVTAIVTGFATFLFTSWRESEKTKYEEKKLLRKALHSLTHLWQTLLVWDFGGQINLATNLLLKGFADLGAKPEDIEKHKFNELDKNKIISIQTKDATGKLREFEKQLDEAIDKVAEIKPFLATELKSIKSGSVNNSIEGIITEQLSDGKERGNYDLNMTLAFENQLFQTTREKYLERLKPFILEIAKEIDKETLKSTEDYLEDLEKHWNEAFSGNDVAGIESAKKFIVEKVLTANQIATEQTEKENRSVKNGRKRRK